MSLGTGPAANRVRRDNNLIGKTVRITLGPMKGYVGVVKDATEQTARVELHSGCKVGFFSRNFYFLSRRFLLIVLV